MAARNAVRSVAGSTPATRSRRSCGTRRPMIAATRTTDWAPSSSWSTRVRSRRVRSPGSAPPDRAAAASSSAKKAFPSARRATSSTTRGDRSAPTRRTMLRRSASGSGPSSSRVRAGRRDHTVSAPARGWRRWMSSLRHVASSPTPSGPPRVNRRVSSSRVDSSAQCTSSTTTSTGPRRPRSARAPCTASTRSARTASPRTPPASRGTRGTSPGWAATSSSTRSRSLASRAATISTNGQVGQARAHLADAVPDEHLPVGGAVDEAADEGGLADARVTTEEDRPAATVGPAEGGGDAVELLVATHEL